GQLPAYEGNFNDVNPPVHAWAAWRIYKIDEKRSGLGDRRFLERVFHKLLLNFTWWVNRKDAEGRNVFQGGFLGLDNIGVFDRSAPLPMGGHIPLKVRSMVGLIPLFAVQTLESEIVDRLPGFKRRMQWFIEHRPELSNHIETETTPDSQVRRFLSLVNRGQLRRVLKYMLDEQEFLSPHGIRALSRFHQDHPYVLHMNGME